MKLEVTDAWVTKAIVAFFGLGACFFGCMVVSYVLWFFGIRAYDII